MDKTDFSILNFLVGVAAVLATVLVPIVVRRSKRLFFDVLCEAWIIDESGKESESSGEFPNEGNRVLFVIEIRNPLWGVFSWLGGVDVAPSQYERNISFDFGEETSILEAQIVSENPPDLGAELIANYYPPYIFFPDNKVVLKPTLLNQGDSLRLRVLVENPTVEQYPPWLGRNSILLKRSGFFTLRAEGRILGVRKIQRKRGFEELTAYALLLLSIAILPVLGFFVVGVGVWLFTRDVDLLRTVPLPWFVAPPPDDISQLLSILTGTQTTFFFAGQILLLIGMRQKRRARKIARQYSPPSSHPLPM